MNALLVYPEFPETFWSFKHALKFLGKRAAQPPLGLMTVAALLPSGWKKRLVDTNVEPLRDRDLAWADVVLLSGMHIQSESLLAIVERCRARGLRTVVGGPISSSVPAAELKADHVVIGEAESLIADLARELETGIARPVYQAAERPEMAASPVPDLSLIKMKRYSTMTVQYSRGCPFNCEFCDIIAIYGRRPRTKAVAQVLAELDQLRAAGWRESVFIVDDNFIGNKARAKELLRALVEWREGGTSFDFITEASLNLADDAELMQLMKDAGFKSVFLGVETPDESGLIASNKLQNTRRSLLESVATIQSYGMEVMGGFILGFDTDKEDIFDRMVDFIQKSGIPIAMVGLLQAMPGTQLFHRLRREGRIVDAGGGNNTFSDRLNFLPRMDAAKLVEGYREVLKRIYSCEAYYERVKIYLNRAHPKPVKGTAKYAKSQQQQKPQPWMTPANMRALVHSIVRQGVFGRHQWSYWKFLAEAATRYRRCFGAAMTLAVMGYHFQVMTQKLSKAIDSATQPAESGEIPLRETGRQAP
jgi:radical SAM superfamily enzyme YgiQ (UPF0313 family)